MTAPDPVMLDVMQNAFGSVAEEMGLALKRTAYSTNIKDRLDFSCAMYTPEGALVAQAEHIPLHLGQMASGVKNVLACLPGGRIGADDIYMVNDPTVTGAHFPDILMLRSVTIENEPIAIVANLAHHVDVGGYVAGSLYSGASEAYQEGVRIPVVRLQRDGVVQQDLLDFFLANTRAKRENMGDCMAQVAALNAGAAKIHELADRHGVADLRAHMQHLIAYAERRMRAALSDVKIEDAVFEDVLEGDGVSKRQLPIRVKVSQRGDTIVFDFAGTSRQAAGPVNATRPFTLACAGFALKAILDPTVPANEGMFGPIELKTPKGSMVDAEFPAAMSNNSSILGLRIVDVIFGALSKTFPERVPAASSGTMNVFTVGGLDPHSGESFAYIEAYGGGQGAFSDLDGMDGVQTTTSNTRNAPAEVIEAYYPLRVRRYGLVESSGGAGQFRGGHGLERDIEFLADCDISIISDRHRTRPWGLYGGEPGRPAACELTLPDGRLVKLAPKVTRNVKRGSRLRLATAGGGGYGPVRRRDSVALQRDVRDGLCPAGRDEGDGETQGG